MRAQLFVFASAFATLALTGCAADVGQEDGTEEDVVGEADALSASGNTGYFIVTRPDLYRKCAAPFCGGVYVKRVNQAKTRCADGSLSDECYVAFYDFAPTGLSTTEADDFKSLFTASKGLVRATMRSTTVGGTKLGKLRVTEAWRGASGIKPGSDFFRTADNGIRCVRAPCPSFTAFKLNDTDSHNLIRVDTSGVAASPADQAAASAALSTKQGILAAGSIALPKCLPGSNCGPFFTAEEFYLRVEHKTAPPTKICGGLAGIQCGKGEFCAFAADAMCGAADQTGTCAKRPDACIQLFKPVCGCDDNTYSNACMAASAGVSVLHDGACTP